MNWFSKEVPIYIFEDDTWEREYDHKIFVQTQNGWKSEGEIIPYGKKAKFIKLKKSIPLNN